MVGQSCTSSSSIVLASQVRGHGGVASAAKRREREGREGGKEKRLDRRGREVNFLLFCSQN